MTRTIAIGPLLLRFNGLVAACVLLVLVALLRLGLWQLDRADEKLAVQDNYLRMQEAPPVPVENIQASDPETDRIQLQNRQVSIRGRYLHEQSIFLIYQTYEEQLGYEIVTPFELSSGEEKVLVSRGWTAAGGYDELVRQLPRSAAEQTLYAQIYVPRASLNNPPERLADPQWPLLIRHLNIEELQGLIPAPLFPYVLRLKAGQDGVLVRHWPEVQVDVQRNFSYALQWFSLALALAIVSLILSSNLLRLLGISRSG